MYTVSTVYSIVLPPSLMVFFFNTFQCAFFLILTAARWLKDGDLVRPSSNLCILHLLHCYRCKSNILFYVILICWCIFDCLSSIFPQSSEFATNWDVFWIVYHQWGNGSVEGSSGLRGLLGVDGTWGGHGKIVNFSNNNLLSWKNWHKKGVKRKAKKRPELALNSWN